MCFFSDFGHDLSSAVQKTTWALYVFYVVLQMIFCITDVLNLGTKKCKKHISGIAAVRKHSLPRQLKSRVEKRAHGLSLIKNHHRH